MFIWQSVDPPYTTARIVGPCYPSYSRTVSVSGMSAVWRLSFCHSRWSQDREADRIPSHKGSKYQHGDKIQDVATPSMPKSKHILRSYLEPLGFPGRNNIVACYRRTLQIHIGPSSRATDSSDFGPCIQAPTHPLPSPSLE